MSNRLPLPPRMRSRTIENVNGLSMHVLEAGKADAPCVLLLHGFPELGYSWRKVMPHLAAAGFRALAPDQRGYGRTVPSTTAYDTDIAPFRLLNLVTDAAALLDALEIDRVEAIVGHDFGSPVAGFAALIRPDLFRRLVLMSAPFAGAPPISSRPAGSSPDDLDRALAALDRPRRHYTDYFSSPSANADMAEPRMGIDAFLRAYFHMKSGDWAGNIPHTLAGAAAEEFAKLPTYYVMDDGLSMPETVAPFDPHVASEWLSDVDLSVYASEFARTGFQGGLNWYRCARSFQQMMDLRVFSGRRVEVPVTFIAGDRDWAVRQAPGAFEAMTERVCTRMSECLFVPSAGHWVQQEAPEPVAHGILRLLDVDI